MAAFTEAVSGELFSITAAQMALFAFTAAVTPPPQTSLGPASACAAGSWYYDTIGMLQPILSFTIFTAALITYNVKRRLATIAGDGPPPPPTRRLRVYAWLALVLSMAATVMAVVMAILLLQVKTSLFSCFSTVAKAIYYMFMLIIGGLLGTLYYDLATVILSSA